MWHWKRSRKPKRLAELSSEYEVHSNMISKWKKQLQENTPEIFTHKNDREPSDKELIDNLYKQIGKSQVEIDWLKKSSDYKPRAAEIVHPQKCVKTVFLTIPATRVIEQLLAKTEIFGQTQFLNPAQSLLEFFAIMVIFGKKQKVLVSTIAQFGRKNQKIRANIQSSCMVIFGQTQPFEPVDYIGRKQKQLEERHIGFPRVAGDFAQRIIVQEFPVVLFDSGSGIVKQINPPGRYLEIGYENMINVSGIFEQSQLFGFLRIFRNRTPDYNKSVGLFHF